MSRHTTYTAEVLDFIAYDEFVMEGSDDEIEDDNIDIDDSPVAPQLPSPLPHDSSSSSQIANSLPPSCPPASSPPADIDITAWTDSLHAFLRSFRSNVHSNH